MNTSIPKLATITLCILGCGAFNEAFAVTSYIPDEAPRTWILADQRDAFIEFSKTGEGQPYYELIRKDFDTVWMDWEFPAEPATYGDPDPSKRTAEMVDKWRAMQDLTGKVTGVAEAAVLLWHVTGEDKYLQKAKHFLLSATSWDPLGSTGIDYNDEAHFRLFRKLPEIFDQIRDELTDAERMAVLEHLGVRGRRNFASIQSHGVPELSRNSVKKSPASHSVRFMAMTGQAGLALYDDLPEARDWWAFVYTWFEDVFTPWGGADGGWAEGAAYWRGVYEHAVFQDVLYSIGDPLAYSEAFWKNTGFFQVYFVQHYPTTGFGDLSNAGQFNMEPGVKHFLDHLARVTDNGYLLSYTKHYSDSRPLPRQLGIAKLYRSYPTAGEYWVRDFIASKAPWPERMPLDDLPKARHFRGIGWVSMHSDLGNPDDDIMLSFKSSPYGSFSHSHGDQNSFILNAYGEQLAINSGYREYHRSQMHKYYTRQTLSKNNILINRHGQEVQDKTATGRIVRFEKTARYTWTTGDATVAFNTRQKGHDLVQTALRDVVFVDDRYFVIRDLVKLKKPGRIDFLLHAREPIVFNEAAGSVTLERNGVFLFSRLLAVNNGLKMDSWTGFPIDPDPKYSDPSFINSQVYLREPAVDQAHFQANTHNDRTEQTLYSVLWPSRDAAEGELLKAELTSPTTLQITRPDGTVDHVQFCESGLTVTSKE